MRLVLASAVLALVSPAGVVVAAPSSGKASEMSAAAFAKRVQSGAVDTSDVRVTGDLSLDGMVVQHALICRDCHFQGLSVHRAVFKQIFDLSGSTITGAANMSDASFLGPVLFGPTPSHGGSALCPNSVGTGFAREANFSLATFGGLAMFAGARFKGRADFTLARFQNDAIFAQGCALQETLFDRSTFAATADFGAYFFDAAPDIDESASFTDVDFHGRTDFSQTVFTGGATFDRARFEQGATFQGATLGRFHGAKRDPRGKTEPLYSFVGTTSAGSLDFGFATFQGRTTFENVNAGSVVSFTDANIDPTCTFIDDAGDTVRTSRCIAIDSLSAGALRMDVDPVLRAVKAPQREAVLSLIESSAKARGDLVQANDAHYQRQVLDNRKDSEPERILDVVFYRTIAGYFVRPINPLLCLVALAGVIALVRTAGRSNPAASDGDQAESTDGEAAKPAKAGAPVEARETPARRLVGLLHRVTHAVASFTVQLMGTLSLIGRRTAEADETPWKRIEIYAYRILVVLVLIGFANSNPTLRQMLDALL